LQEFGISIFFIILSYVLYKCIPEIKIFLKKDKNINNGASKEKSEKISSNPNATCNGVCKSANDEHIFFKMMQVRFFKNYVLQQRNTRTIKDKR